MLRKTKVFGRLKISVPAEQVNKLRANRYKERLEKIKNHDPFATPVLQLSKYRSAGSIGSLVNFLVTGNQLPEHTGIRIVKKSQTLRDALQFKIASMSFFGSSSQGQVVVECDGLGNLKHVKMSAAVAKLSKKQQQYFIASAVGDAISKARAYAYGEFIKVSDASFEELYEALEAYNNNEEINAFSSLGNNTLVSTRVPFVSATADMTAAKIETLHDIIDDPYDFLDDHIPKYKVPEVLIEEASVFDEDADDIEDGEEAVEEGEDAVEGIEAEGVEDIEDELAEEPEDPNEEYAIEYEALDEDDVDLAITSGWNGDVASSLTDSISDYYRTRVLINELPKMMIEDALDKLNSTNKGTEPALTEADKAEFDRFMKEHTQFSLLQAAAANTGDLTSAMKHTKRNTADIPTSALQRQKDWYSWLFQLKKRKGGYNYSSAFVSFDKH